MMLSAQAESYICRLIGDKYSLEYPPVTVETAAMKRGTQLEPEARSYYEMDRGLDVEQDGFCMTDDGRFGCSPDGLVGIDGGLELKCPSPSTHVSYLLEGVLPSEYKAQVHGSMIVTGRAWWDFMSYCPGLPPLLIRVGPDDYTEKLRTALEAFWLRLIEADAKIAAMGGQL